MINKKFVKNKQKIKLKCLNSLVCGPGKNSRLSLKYHRKANYSSKNTRQNIKSFLRCFGPLKKKESYNTLLSNKKYLEFDLRPNKKNGFIPSNKEDHIFFLL